MNYRNPYTVLGWIAIVAVPIAPVFFFAWDVYKEVLGRANYWLLAAGVGLVSAIGLELVGVLAGHLAMEFWRTGNTQRAILSGGIMGVYVLIGVVQLWGTIGMVMFIIAPLVYVLVALRQVAEQEATEQARHEKRSVVIDYRAKEAQAERQHKLELERLRLANEVKLAKVAAATTPQPIEVAPVAPRLTPAQERVYNAFTETPGATITEVAERLGTSRQAVSKHVKAMNGVMHEVRL